MATDRTDSEERTWRPFPWCLAPDWFWYAFGLWVLIFISVPIGAMIATTTVAGEACFLVYKTCAGRFVAKLSSKAIGCCSEFVGSYMLKDKRNHPYLPWMLLHTCLPPVLLYWAWKRHTVHGFEMSTMLIYHFIRLGPRFRFFAYHHVLIHKEGHDSQGFFRDNFTALNQINQFWAGLFYGSVARSYPVAHNKIHHRWHNDVDDVHTNMDVDRTVFSNYILYLPRFVFYWTGVSPIILFLKRGEYGYVKDLGFGMLYYYGVGAALWVFVGPSFFFAYFVYPLFEAIAFLGAIAYLWHAFIQPDDPENQYINSVTILNGKDNIFNEDYHVVHHHAPHVHWTDMPKYYEETKAKYAACTATIFRDTEEGELLYWLFTGKWDEMAAHFVDLNNKLTHEEKKELILKRLRFVLKTSDGRKFLNILEKKDKPSQHTSFSSWGTSAQRDWDMGKND